MRYTKHDDTKHCWIMFAGSYLSWSYYRLVTPCSYVQFNSQSINANYENQRLELNTQNEQIPTTTKHIKSISIIHDSELLYMCWYDF